MSLRLAKITDTKKSVEGVACYLPSNYKIVGRTLEGELLISGRDHAGWTLEGYVIPRLGSGLIPCVEIENN